MWRESINQKLKSVISKFAHLPQFCCELLKVLSSFHVERDHRAITLFQKVPSQPFPKGLYKYQYMQVVTPFALSDIVKQIDLASQVKLKSEVGNSYICESTSKSQVVSSVDDCNCSFRKTMQLPCKHMFTICKKTDLPLFEPTLCAEHWTLQYYKSSQYVLHDQDTCDENFFHVTCMVPQTSKQAVLSQHEKFRKANHVMQKLASLASEVSMKEFNVRLACLEGSIWEQGGYLSVIECYDNKEGMKAHGLKNVTGFATINHVSQITAK